MQKRASAFIAIWLLFTCGLGLAAASSAPNEEDEARLVRYLNHAETCYWVAMAERGSLTVLTHGKEFLEKAKAILEVGPAELKEKYEEEYEALSKDIHYQYVIASDTLYGLFPLSRFFNPSIFGNPHSTGSFELFDDPEVVAVREAVENLIDHVLEAQTVIPQFDVLFVSDPVNVELENEALYLFNLSPRFFVHNLREVDRVMTDEEMEECRSLTLTPKTRVKILEELGTNTVLLVRLREVDSIHGDYFYSAEGRLYGSDEAPAIVLNNYGFSIDRRAVLPAVILLHALLLIMAIAAYMIGYRQSLNGGEWPRLGRAALLGAGSYAWGRVLVWMVVPIFFAIQPSPERIALWSFWWPLATGASILFVPIAAIWVAISRFNLRLVASPSALIAPVMLGASAYLVECLLLYKGLAGGLFALPLLAGILALAALTMAFSRKDMAAKPLLGVAAAITTLLLVGGATAVSMSLLLAGAGFGITSALFFFLRHCRHITNCNETCCSKATVDEDSLPNERANNLREAIDRLIELDQMVYMAIVGPEGCGKSHTLGHVLGLPVREVYSGHTIYHGTCPPTGEMQIPYAPFAEACRRHLSETIFASTHGQSKKVFDDAVNKVFDTIVPFSNILFSSKPNATAGSKAEIHIEIYNFLKRHSMKSKILFVIDDCFNMDAASVELLEFMIHRIHEEAHPHIKFILLGRQTDLFPELPDSDRIIHEFPKPDTGLVVSIVERKYGLKSTCAKRLVEMLGVDGANLKWTLEVVNSMVQRGCFKDIGGKLDWEGPEKDASKHLPTNVVEVISGDLMSDPQIRPILQCAACLGYTFEAGVIGKALGLERLELLQALDRVEQDSEWIFDLRDRDDQYRFRSTLVYRAIRERFGIATTGPATAVLSQLIREYHAQLAQHLEEAFERETGDIYSLANQYYLAGPRFAPKAVTYCLLAAEVASSRFMHSLAHEYCEKASEYCPFGEFEEPVARAKARVSCNESHFDGHERVHAVQVVGDYLAKFGPTDFEMYFLMMRALYDAGQSERDQAYFKRCFDYGIDCLARFPAPLDQAVAHHFMGISLPRDRGEERRAELEMAKDLVGETWAHDVESARIYSRIINSLADELSFGSDQDKALARNLYLQSVEIKQRPEIADTMGLAMSYGGLGRLEFYAASPNYRQAKAYFEQDLLYSEKIGNALGVCKMFSFMGMCDAAEGKWTDAYDNFSQSYDAATSELDRLFALAGLLQSAQELKRNEAVEKHGRQLSATLKQAVNDGSAERLVGICRDELKMALDACGEHAATEWHRLISEHLG